MSELIITRRSWDRSPAPSTERLSPQSTSTLEWLDLVPDGYLPAGYEDALRSELAATQRLAEVGRRTSELEAQLAAGGADQAVDPAQLVAVAQELAAWQRVCGAIPEPAPVPKELHHELIREFTSRWPDITPGRPPMVAAEAVHYVITHAPRRDAPPIVGEHDVEAIETFARVCADSARLTEQGRTLASELNSPIEHRIRALIEFRKSLDKQAAVIRILRDLIERVDADRIASGRAHRCQFWSGKTVTLEPIPAGAAWTLEWALAGNGRPPIAGVA